MTRVYMLAAFVALIFVAPERAHAHAHLTAATPAANSTVAASPSEVSITYTEGVEPKFSSIVVQDAAGARVDTGNAHTPAEDDKRLIVGLKPLPPGVYKVIWHATALDTHKTEGSFTFTVAP